ncbi:uncharacterized protein LOC117792148 [Drosophila innubila]|uniref:uncharacterized protein LOC117792148 n=1 Tax=Drosophila innubila TaxID=198719 RepID=UPI00148B45F5|nr:uncharacterized protein LOC117792148 [Drosophila innubila]
MHVGYRIRRMPLVRHALLAILQLLQKSLRPMRDTEILAALSVQYQRSDPEFLRQLRVNLLDAVDYGILKRQSNVFSLRSKRFGEIMRNLVPQGGSQK